MRKIIIYAHFFLSLCIAGPMQCSPLDALNTAKKQLEDGKQSILDGKKGIIDGYTNIKWNVVDALNNAADGVQKQMDSLGSQKAIASDMLNKKMPELLGLLSGATAVLLVSYPPMGVAFGALATAIPIQEAVLWDIPTTMGAIIDTLASIVKTLHDAVQVINPANEKLNPHSSSIWIERTNLAIADIKNKSNALQPSMTDALNKLSQILTDATQHSNPTTKKITDTATIDSLIDRLNNIKSALPAELTNAIKGLIDQLKEEKNTKEVNTVPAVYQKFDSAVAKFDNAINQINEIIEGFQDTLNEI